MIDVHCHHLALTERNGGYIDPKFAESWRIKNYLASIGIVGWQDAFFGRLPARERLDELYREKMLRELEGSPLDHAVVLAFDGVYDAGKFDRGATANYVSNDAVIALRERSPKILLGASVNPLRRDWRDELDKCLESGAVLIKWLPNVMGFDPADPRIEIFYEKLAEAKIPILMHVGFEYAVPVKNKHYSDLDRVEPALRRGVTVIGAHCCGGRFFIDSPKMFREMKGMLERYPNFYLDVAALASVHRKSRFLAALRDPLVSSRLVFGTDYPIPVHGWAFRKETRSLELPKNYFAKDIAIKEATGLDHEALARGYVPIKHRFCPDHPRGHAAF